MYPPLFIPPSCFFVACAHPLLWFTREGGWGDEYVLKGSGMGEGCMKPFKKFSTKKRKKWSKVGESG